MSPSERLDERTTIGSTTRRRFARPAASHPSGSPETTRERIAAIRRRGVDAVAPVLQPITGFGWLVLATTLAALVVGIVLQWKEFVIIGLVGMLLMAAAIAFVVGRTQYRVELDLAYTRVVVGERALGRIQVHATASRTLAPVIVEVPVGGAIASFALPRMRPGDVHEDIFAIPTQRRAVLQLGPVRSVKSDPLGLLRRQVDWTDPVELFVHPKTVQLEEATPGLIRDLEGITTRDLTNSDISFHALRDYVAGDDRRYIHWKSSARTGSLMVRQFEQTRRSVLALGLSTQPDDYIVPGRAEEADDTAFEVAISVLGSLGLQAIRDEMDLVVETSKQRLPATTGKRLLDGLSGIEQHPRHDGFLALAGRIGREHAGASVVILHAGIAVDVATVQRARLMLPPQARVLVVLSGVAAPGVRSIGDVTLATVGSIDELPRIMRGVGVA